MSAPSLVLREALHAFKQTVIDQRCELVPGRFDDEHKFFDVLDRCGFDSGGARLFVLFIVVKLVLKVFGLFLRLEHQMHGRVEVRDV